MMATIQITVLDKNGAVLIKESKQLADITKILNPDTRRVEMVRVLRQYRELIG